MGSWSRTGRGLAAIVIAMLALIGCAGVPQAGSDAANGTPDAGNAPAEPNGPAAASVVPSPSAPPAATPAPVDGQGNGPLRVHQKNPRYFTDDDGNAIYLTGSHTWTNLQAHHGTPSVAYDAYLDVLEQHNHNFVRLWRWEHTRAAYQGIAFTVSPQPWQRTGPGFALDGLPRFDLTALEQSYFDLLRARVVAAGARGMYVSIMLFEGHAIAHSEPPWNWDGHPFHPDNNINQLGVEHETLHTLDVAAGLEIEKAYVRMVIDSVNDLDNVLYEIANEDGQGTVDWQYHLIDYIKEYERTKPKQHPVGMTYRYNSGTNAELLASPADWISLGTTEYAEPAVNDGGKVVILDTDHIWGVGGDGAWVWKAFLRGHNPIYMDPFDRPAFPAADETARRAMGQTLEFVRRVDLAAMQPRPELASSSYALASSGGTDDTYVVYTTGAGDLEVDLSGSGGELTVEWFDPLTERTIDGGTVAGGGVRSFTVPFPNAAVLLLRAT